MADDLDGNVGTYGVGVDSGSDSESFELAEPEPVAPQKKGKGAAKAEAKAVKGDKNAKNPKKRKAETDGEELLEEQKRLKKKQKRKEEKKRKSKLIQEKKEAELSNPVQFQSAEGQSLHFFKIFKDNYGKDLSQIELESEQLPETCFAKPKRDEWKLEDLPFVLEELDDTILKPANKKEKKGAPKMVIVVPSAYRAIDVFKATEEFKKRGLKVGQFFAKHKKLEEQAFFLKNNVARVALGTPGRIQKLIEEGSLKTEDIKYLVVDMSRDAKTFTIMDIRTTRDDFFNLYNSHFKDRVKKNQTQIVYF
eukprot:TRINITY_DN15266_c0_g1_i1.p1 TRINITY_DN15266_c0_g1~~TRINITY_DN15266_c0_g1_i1.p1  ORF type:complete len:332 (-),score=95.30 TRINITY_DN15266_c0_g1_i1:33-953(-)